MPKKIEQVFYKCEVCGKLHEKLKDAVICEFEHQHIEKIVKEVFPKSDTPERYPRRILVKFADGQRVRYSIADISPNPPLDLQTFKRVINNENNIE